MKLLYPYTEKQLANYSIESLNTIYTRFTKVEKTKHNMAYWIEQVCPNSLLTICCDLFTKKEIQEHYLMWENRINEKKLELFNKYTNHQSI